MGHIRGALLIIGGLLIFNAAIRADSLQLKNGNSVQGKYMGGTERAVQFEVNGKMRIYDIDQILSISFAAASVDGGMPSNSAETGQNRDADRCMAAKSPAPRSAAKGRPKLAMMQSVLNASRGARKPAPSGRTMVQVNRPLRTNWTRAGDYQSMAGTSLTGTRFAWLPERIDVLAS